jgi:hypothetical protein
MTRADPGSGERGGAGCFTFKFMVDFNNLKNVTINFKDLFANKEFGGSLLVSLDPRLMTLQQIMKQ